MKQDTKHAAILRKKTENLSFSSFFHLYFCMRDELFISWFWGWLLSYLFRYRDIDRHSVSQGYGGIILRGTSLLVFWVGSFEKFDFCIRGSLCQAKIYQGIPERHKFRIRNYKVSINQFNLLFIACLLIFLLYFTQYVPYLYCCQPHSPIFLLPLSCLTQPLNIFTLYSSYFITSSPKIFSSASFFQYSYLLLSNVLLIL